jgi:hypothetical protein
MQRSLRTVADALLIGCFTIGLLTGCTAATTSGKGSTGPAKESKKDSESPKKEEGKEKGVTADPG